MLEGAICLCISLIVLSPFFCVSIDHYNTVVALAKEYEVPENEPMLEFDLKDVSPMIPEYFGEMLDDIEQMPKVEEPEPIVDPDPEPQLEEKTVSQSPEPKYSDEQQQVIPKEFVVNGISYPNVWGYTYKQIDDMNAYVSGEDDKSYKGAKAVMSAAVNRTLDIRWKKYGSDPLSQLEYPGQFCATINNDWMEHLNGNSPVYVQQAVMEVLMGETNHNYVSFNQIGCVEGGGEVIGDNEYFNPMITE